MSTREWQYPRKREGTSLLLVTDLHHGRRDWTAGQLNAAGATIDWLTPHIDGVAVGGDLIHWGKPTTPEDSAWTSWFNARNKTIPWAVVAGNHDYASFAEPLPTRNVTQWMAAAANTGRRTSVDVGDVRVLGVFPDRWDFVHVAPLELSAADIAWLDAELKAAGKPCWILCHSPIPQQYTGHLEAGTATAVTALIANNPNVLGWLSGHRHADIRTDVKHAMSVTIGGKQIAAINGPPSGGQVLGTSIDPWDSQLHGMVLTYASGRVRCRWINLITRQWDNPFGNYAYDLTVTV